MIAVASAALVLMRPAWLPLGGALLAILGIWIGLAPGFAYFVNSERAPIPLLPLTGLSYVVFFALPVFFLDPDAWTSASGKSGTLFGLVFQQLDMVAIGMVPAGLSLMFGACMVSARILRGRVPHISLPRPKSSGRVRFLLWPLLLGHLAYLIVPSIGQMASIGQFLGPVGYLAFGMFFLLFIQGRLPRAEAMAVFLVLLPVELVQLFATGLLTKLVYFGIFMAVMIMYVRRWRMIFVLIAFIGVFFVAFYPAVKEYRVQSWNAAASGTSAQTKTALFIDIMVDKWRNGFKRDNFTGMELPLVRRVSLIVLFSFVVDKTPETVPYLRGTTYKPLLTSFIPRVIWPGKPKERLGQVFGHRYRILLPDDKTTSINVPWIVEMYANFGIWGVLIGMTLVGILLAFLEAVFNRAEMSPLEFVTGTTILLPLFYQESNISLMTGSMLPLTICLWLYFRVGLTLGNRNASP